MPLKKTFALIFMLGFPIFISPLARRRWISLARHDWPCTSLSFFSLFFHFPFIFLFLSTFFKIRYLLWIDFNFKWIIKSLFSFFFYGFSTFFFLFYLFLSSFHTFYLFLKKSSFHSIFMFFIYKSISFLSFLFHFYLYLVST